MKGAARLKALASGGRKRGSSRAVPAKAPVLPRTHKLWLAALKRKLHPLSLPTNFSSAIDGPAVPVIDLSVESAGRDGGLENAYGDVSSFATGALVQFMCEYLEYNRSLRELRLERNLLRDATLARLASKLEPKALLELHLGGNLVAEEGCRALAALLSAEGTVLRVLSLPENRATDECATAIGAALENNTTLQKLDLSSNRLTDAGVAALAPGLGAHAALRTLILGGHLRVGAEGARAISEGLRKNLTLTSLDLSDTYVGDVGVGMLAAVLRRNSALLELRLRGCELGERGGRELAAAFVPFSDSDGADDGQLDEASSDGDDTSDELDSEDFAALDDVGCVSALRVLDLSCNDLGPDAVVALLSALKANDRLPLRRLSLAHNPALGSRVGCALQSLLETNKTLLFVDLRGTELGEDGLDSLELGWGLHTPLCDEVLADEDCAAVDPWYVRLDERQRPRLSVAAQKRRTSRTTVCAASIVSCDVQTEGHNQRRCRRRPASNIPTWALLETSGKGARRYTLDTEGKDDDEEEGEEAPS